MHRDAEMIRNLSNPRTGDLITETPSLSLPGRLRLRLADMRISWRIGDYACA